jgi:hypothetical protein
VRETPKAKVNSNQGVSLGRQGRLDYVNFGTFVSPHLSRCPKFFFPDRLDTLQLPADDLFLPRAGFRQILSLGKPGTPPCKSGQLEKDLGLEASSPRHAARLIIFEIMRSFFVGSKSSRSPSRLIQLKPSWCIASTAYCQSRPESCAR